MKVALINTPYVYLYGPIKLSAGRYFPLGIGYLAAVLKNNGHDVLFLDPEVQQLSIEKLSQILRKERPDIVGITCTTPNFIEAMKIARMSKESIQAKVILGGVHASAVPEWALSQCPEIDLVVIGEGELTLLEICNSMSNNRYFSPQAIAGLVYRDNNGVSFSAPRNSIEDLDSLPYPAREMIPPRFYEPHPYVNRGKSSTTILTSRGCPSQCTFCASHLTMGKKFRFHSAEYVVGEVEYLIKNFGINHLVINDDTFTMNLDRAEDICLKLIKKKVKIDWYCFMRVNNVTRDLVKLMKEAGCSSIGFGVESADINVLKNIKKGITLDQCRQAFRICNKEDIKTLAFFVFGCPGENRKSVKDTIQFAKELKPTLAFFNQLVPYPGTEIFNLYYKHTLDNLDNFSNFVAIGPKAAVGSSHLGETYPQKSLFMANINFYLRPIQLIRIVKKIESWRELRIHLKAAYGLLLQMICSRKNN